MSHLYRSITCALIVLNAAAMPRVGLGDEGDSPSAAGVEFFEKHVRSLLVEHCYECHAGDEANGGLLLNSRAGILAGGDTGDAIVPGSASDSLFVEAVRYDNPDLQMPPEGRLSDAEVKIFEDWIAMGAPDPREADRIEISASGMAIEEGRKFWSFRPPAQPDVPSPSPSSSSNDWIQNPIDAFILTRLEADDLQPAPRADRKQLIRRLTYDLIGLPPTVEEVGNFMNDDSPQAYKRLVERLLASEQYGARWGRHWLDVARYADSNGLDENLAFGNAWRYRDYVVDSFNKDIPYDRFVIEQLAGDLLPDADERTKIATGFLVLGAKVLAEPDREKLEMDTIDEQLDTTGKALLGMTFGCVRCHDHKFDPITQRDYYALATIFKSTKTFGETNTGAIKHWHEHVFATPEDLESIKEFDTLIETKKKAASKFKNDAMAELREQARKRATDYLVAATLVELDMSLKQVERIASPLDLHPRILHHCRRHLHFNSQDPFLQPWHAMSTASDREGIATFYAPLFAEAAKPADAASSKESDEESHDISPEQRALLETAKKALMDKSGFLAVPPKPAFAFDTQTLAEYDRLMDEARITESLAPDTPAAMGVSDSEVAVSLPIHIRGSHRNLGREVQRDVPEVMRPEGTSLDFPTDQSGRLELAKWIADPSHPLTARVYVNRIWRWHFGNGLVRTTENFGVLGDSPSHPELLDWLSVYLVQQGWSTKQLHRLIVHSSTYQQRSLDAFSSRAAEVDPENRLLWNFPMLRLEAEQIHDSILEVAGILEPSLDGKTVPLRNRQFVFNHTSVDHTKYDSTRRAIYLPIIRNNLYTTFEQFDFPDPTIPTGDRASTVVAPQALLMMNSKMVMEAAGALAHRLLRESASIESRVERAFQSVLRRNPTASEVARATDLIQDLQLSSGVDKKMAWSMLCQSLIASNEFLYLR